MYQTDLNALGYPDTEAGESYAAATHKDDAERFEPASCSGNPDHTDEEDHPEDVLDTRKVDTKNCTQLVGLHTPLTLPL